MTRITSETIRLTQLGSLHESISGESPGWESDPAPPDRRTVNRLLSPGELLLVGRFMRLYKQEFGRQFDIEKFSRDDVYGREILGQALASSNQPLSTIARRLIDESGKALYQLSNA